MTESDENPKGNGKLLRTGVAGLLLSAICCFTPILVILLGSLGLSAWLGWLDYVLLPSMVLFMIITAYALVKKSRSRKNSP